MKRSAYYARQKPPWDGICARCHQSYFENRGNTTCLACNAQRQGEYREGLLFEDDPESEHEEARMMGILAEPLAKRAARIRKLRTDRNLTQAQAAERVGVQPNTWARWERAESGITSVTPAGIAAKLDCPVPVWRQTIFVSGTTAPEGSVTVPVIKPVD